MEEVQSHLSTTEAEISLLDLLVTLAENVKLLILGPVMVGLCALGIGYLLPKTYESVAILQAEQITASLMVTATVLDPVIIRLGLAKDGSVEGVRLKLREQIKAVAGRNEKTLTLTVSAGTPEEAQAIGNALLQQTYQESRPKGMMRARLEAQLAEVQLRFKNARDVSGGLLKRLESNGSAVNGGGEIVRGYADLLTVTGAAQSQISALEVQLEGLSEAQLVQAPTLPQKASQPKKGLIAISAALAALLVLLLFVCMRQALRNAAANPEAVGKLAGFGWILGLKRGLSKVSS